MIAPRSLHVESATFVLPRPSSPLAWILQPLRDIPHPGRVFASVSAFVDREAIVTLRAELFLNYHPLGCTIDYVPSSCIGERPNEKALEQRITN